MVGPQEWADEEYHDDPLVGTRQLFDLIMRLHENGDDIEIVAKWTDDGPPKDEFMDVDVDGLDSDQFVVYDDCKMKIRPR